MTLDIVKKYFEEDDMYHGFNGDHPMKHHFEECQGIAFVSRAKKSVLEIVFRCARFGGAHIVRECKDNCPNFKLCPQISTVLEKEAILESLYPIITE